jgi:hypothetical protein
MAWDAVVDVVYGLRLEVKLQIHGLENPECWTKFLIIPVDGYIESNNGPVPFREVDCLLINHIRSTHRGRLLSPLIEDVLVELSRALNDAGAVYNIEEQGVRVTGFIV